MYMVKCKTMREALPYHQLGICTSLPFCDNHLLTASWKIGYNCCKQRTTCQQNAKLVSKKYITTLHTFNYTANSQCRLSASLNSYTHCYDCNLFSLMESQSNFVDAVYDIRRQDSYTWFLFYTLIYIYWLVTVCPLRKQAVCLMRLIKMFPT